MSAPTPKPPEAKSPKAKRPKRWLRWLRRLGLTLLGLISLVVIALLVILWVPWASQRAVRFGLERWDAGIPGEVVWRDMSGSLGAGLVVEELELRDGEGRALIRVGAIVVDLDAARLLRIDAVLERVHARDLEVWIDHDWSALSGQSEASDVPPSEGLGPNLPVWISADVKVERLTIYQDERPLLRNEGLALWLGGVDRRARAELELSGAELPQQEFEIDGLELALAWDEPSLVVERLELETSLGKLHTLETSQVDLEVWTGDVALEFEADTQRLDTLAARLGIPQLRAPDPATIRVFGRVEHVEDPSDELRARVLVTAALGPETSLALIVEGTAGNETVEPSATLHVDGQLGAGLIHPEQAPLTLALDAGIRQGEAGEFEATTELRVHDRDQGSALVVDAGGTALSLSPPQGAAWIGLRGPGFELSASAARSDARSIDARWSVVVADIEQVLEQFTPYVDEPRLAQLRGSLAWTGSCTSAPGRELATARCPIQLELDHVAGFDARLAHASLRGELSPLAEPLEFRAWLELEGLVHPSVALDEARIAVAGTPARFSVEGRGQGLHERFELAAALALDGPNKTLDLSELVLVSSRGASPAEVVLAAPTRIVIRPEKIVVDELRARALGGTIVVEGHVGLAGTTSDLQVALHTIDLARLDALIPGPRLSGVIDLEGELRGHLDHPSGWVWLKGEALEVDANHLGELRLAANLCGPGSDADDRPAAMRRAAPRVGECGRGSAGELQLWLRNTGPIAAAIELDARLPLRSSGGFGLRARRELQAHVVVRELDLVELGGFMPATPSWWRQIPPDSSAPPGDLRLIPEGQLDLDLTLSGTSSRAQVELSARASSLVIDQTELGSILVRATLGDAGLVVDLDAALRVAKLDLDLELPIRLDLARPKLTWDHEAEQVVALALRDLDIDRLERTLGPKLPALAELLAVAELGGRVSASVSGHGLIDDPWLSASLDVDELSHRGERLGDLRVELDHHGELATATLSLEGPLARRLDARVELPLHLTLSAKQPWVDPRIAVDSGARVHAEAHVHRVDLASLQPHIGALPVAGLADLDLLMRGSLADPKLELEARLAKLQIQAERAGDLTIYATADREHATIDTDLVRRGEQLFTSTLEIPLRVELADLEHPRVGWRREGLHRVSAHADAIDHELLVALIGGPLGGPLETHTLDSNLRLDMAGSGRASAFALRVDLDGCIAAREGLPLAIHGALAIDQSHQTLELTLDPGTGAGLRSSASLDADVARLVSGQQTIGDVPFTLELDAPNFALDLLAPLIAPELHDPSGTLHANFSGAGVLSAPVLSGSLAIHHGAVTVLALRERLREIEVDLALDHDVVTLRTLSLAAGRGQISGSGQANIDPSTRKVDARLAFDIADIPVVRPGLPAMTISTEAKLDIDLGDAQARLRVALAKSEVKVSGISGSAPKPVPSSDAVVFVTDLGQVPEPLAGADSAASSVDAVGSKLTLSLDLVDPLQITGPSIDMAWTGSLGITRDAAGLGVEGQLEAERGRLELLGHRFELRRGIVNLPADGSLDPFLDIIAETSTSAADVTVTIRGRASKPELRFSSTPAMTDYQIVTLLVTGSTELGQGEGDVETKAASLLAAFSSPALQRHLDRYLGIDQAKIGFGDSVDQPILSVGKRVSSKVFVETTYHHNAPKDENTAEVGIEYDFAPHWSLETYFGDAAVGGVGVYWTHGFGPVPWVVRAKQGRGR